MSKSALLVFCPCEAAVDARSRRRGRADSPDRRTDGRSNENARRCRRSRRTARGPSAKRALPSLGETMSSSEGGEPTLKCVCVDCKEQACRGKERNKGWQTPVTPSFYNWGSALENLVPQDVITCCRAAKCSQILILLVMTERRRCEAVPKAAT